MKDLLIEIGCEDLPARYVLPLAEALRDSVSDGLDKASLTVDRHHESGGTSPCVFATPRRIAVLFNAVRDHAEKGEIVAIKGPKLAVALKDGQPTQAGLGFAKKNGVEFSELTQEDGQLVFRSAKPAVSASASIPTMIEDAFRQMDVLVPKRMRWGSGNETFVRPVQWLTVLFGEQVVPFERFGLHAERITYGHRFHAPQAITLATASDYEPKLRNAMVLASIGTFDQGPLGRRESIRFKIEQEAVHLGGTAKIDEALLDEVTALVEWPVVISGRIEERFLELPPEVIVATVETNQRYFTVFDTAGKLLPCFIAIANIESTDVAKVVEGNERVVRPRLSDALFFWQQDLKQPLESYSSKLEHVTYQKDLGSVAARVQRIVAISDRIMKAAGGLQAVDYSSAAVKRAAALSKCDLATRMVYEFPELQGFMGGKYAEEAGEPANVASAISEHYLPTQAGTPIPSTREGQIVALADKLDSLAGIFAIGQKPTASKDPFALRRAALGVLRILIEGGFALDVRDLLSGAVEEQPAGKRDPATLDELTAFVMERLRGYLVGTGIGGRAVTSEMFEAVMALGITQPLDFMRRVQAILAFWAQPEAQSLAAAHKRVRNILRQAETIEKRAIDPSLFESDAERVLAESLEKLDVRGVAAGYTGRLERLAGLKSSVDAFFADVMVMADDPAVRANRIALLRRLDAACREVADLSCLPG